MLYALQDYLVIKHKIGAVQAKGPFPLAGIDLTKYIYSIEKTSESGRSHLIRITEVNPEAGAAASTTAQRTLRQLVESGALNDGRACYISSGTRRLGQKKSEMFAAIRTGDFEKFKELHDLGACDEVFDNNIPACFYALERKQYEIVDYFLLKNPSLFDLKWDKQGSSEILANPFLTVDRGLFLHACDLDAEELEYVYNKFPQRCREQLFSLFSYTFSHGGFDIPKIEKKYLKKLEWFLSKDSSLLARFKDTFIDYAKVPEAAGLQIHQKYKELHHSKQVALPQELEQNPIHAKVLPAIMLMEKSFFFNSPDCIEKIREIDPRFYQDLMEIKDSYFHKILLSGLESYARYLPSSRLRLIERFPELKKYVTTDVFQKAQRVIKECDYNKQQMDGLINLFLWSNPKPSEIEDFFYSHLFKEGCEDQVKLLVDSQFFFVHPSQVIRVGLLLDSEEKILRFLRELKRYPEFHSKLKDLLNFNPLQHQNHPAMLRLGRVYRKTPEFKTAHQMEFKASHGSVVLKDEALVHHYNQKISFPEVLGRDLDVFSELEALFSSMSTEDFRRFLDIGTHKKHTEEEANTERALKLQGVRSFLKKVKEKTPDIAIPAGKEEIYYQYVQNILAHLLVHLRNEREDLMLYIQDLTYCSGICYTGFSTNLIQTYQRLHPEEKPSEQERVINEEDEFKEEFLKTLTIEIKQVSSKYLVDADVHIASIFKNFFVKYAIPHVEVPAISDREVLKRPKIIALLTKLGIPLDQTKTTEELEHLFNEVFIRYFKRIVLDFSVLEKSLTRFLEEGLEKDKHDAFVQQLSNYVTHYRSFVPIDSSHFDLNEILEYDDASEKSTLKQSGALKVLWILLYDPKVVIRS